MDATLASLAKPAKPGRMLPEAMTAIPFAKRATQARNVVVLTGAGISVASGLRPYRGPGGLWTTNPELVSRLVAGIDAENLWTITCEWRKELAKAQPNAAHEALAARAAPPPAAQNLSATSAPKVQPQPANAAAPRFAPVSCSLAK